MTEKITFILDGREVEASPDETIWHDELFSTQYACPNCKISYEELEPRTFSFNSPYGACPTCDGLGVVGDDRVRRVALRDQWKPTPYRAAIRE